MMKDFGDIDGQFGFFAVVTPDGMMPTPITRSIGRNCRKERRSVLSASRSRKSRTPTKVSRSRRLDRRLESPVVPDEDLLRMPQSQIPWLGSNPSFFR